LNRFYLLRKQLSFIEKQTQSMMQVKVLLELMSRLGTSEDRVNKLLVVHHQLFIPRNRKTSRSVLSTKMEDFLRT